MLRQGWGGEGLEWRYVQAGERFGGQVLRVFPECVAKGSRFTLWGSGG